jgi:hypothetical protein
MPGFHGLVAVLATACTIYAAAAHVVIENDYEVVNDATAQKRQQSNAYKLGGGKAGGMWFRFGTHL